MKVRNILTFLANIVILFILLPVILNAQVSSIHKGDMIRVTAPEYFLHSVIGIFADLKNDTLNFRMEEETYAIPLRQVTKLEVVRGKKRNVGNVALIGGVVGGLGLGLIAFKDASQHQGEWFTPTPRVAFFGGFFVGGLLGSLTGAIIGSNVTSIHWEEVFILL